MIPYRHLMYVKWFGICAHRCMARPIQLVPMGNNLCNVVASPLNHQDSHCFGVLVNHVSNFEAFF
jgi:hypothetical protein